MEKSDKIHFFTGAAIKTIEGFIGNYKTTIDQNGKETSFEHGVVLSRHSAYELETKDYLYGESDRFVTQRELEKMLFEKDGKVQGSKRVVMIQCVGSRNKERILQPLLLRRGREECPQAEESDPGREVTILYRTSDLRVQGGLLQDGPGGRTCGSSGTTRTGPPRWSGRFGGIPSAFSIPS